MRKRWLTRLGVFPFALCGALALIIALSFFHSFGIDYAPIHDRIWECGLDRSTVVITSLGHYENEGWKTWHNAPGILRQQVKANQDADEISGTRWQAPGILYAAYGQYLQFSFPSWLLLPPVFALACAATAVAKRTNLLRRTGRFTVVALRYGIPLVLALLSATTIFSFYRCLYFTHPTNTLNIMTLDRGVITEYRDPFACFFDPENSFGTDTAGSSLDPLIRMEDPSNLLPGDYYFRCTPFCCIYRGMSGSYTAFPLWPVLALTDIAAFFFFYRPLRSIRRRRLSAMGHCTHCDYDLRAHHAGGAGDKCPECGTLIPTA